MASNKNSKRLEARIASMKDNERRLLYKRAAQMRKAASDEGKRPKHRQDLLALDGDAWDENDAPVSTEKRKRRHKGSLAEWAERLVEEDGLGSTSSHDSGGESTDGHAGLVTEGLVLFATSGRCRVLLEDPRAPAGENVVDCILCPEIATHQKSDLAIGDRVEVTHVDCVRESDTDAPPLVVGVLPRRSTLSRPDSGPGGQWVERVIAANVDRVVVVASAQSPPLRPRLLDRYLVAIEHGGAVAAIAVTKTDLLDEAVLAELLSELSHYPELGTPLLACSSVDGRGLDSLRDLLAGETAVFVGQSGVGKSSLLNALDPTLAIETRTVGTADKGRHTTTASTLYRLGNETQIIDTPGVREFGLWQLTREELREYFHEFDPYAPACRFGDCSHVHEPDCAVVAAVGASEIAEVRYDSYVRLVGSLSD